MGQPKVLIAGASVGGPCLAHWLVRAGCEVTIVERSSELRTTGQSIDLRNDGVRIMRQMGIEEAIRAKTTSERGLQFVNTSGKVMATLGATGNPEAQSITSEYEIFRGDLALILYDLTKDRVKYIFGDYIKSLTQNERARTVTAEFHNGTPTETYDLVVGCDGLGSRTRAMAFQKDIREYIKPLNCYAVWFTIKKDLLDGSQFAQWINCPGGKSVMLRPDPTGANRASLFTCGPKSDRANIEKFLKAEEAGGMDAVKKIMGDMFQDAGWMSKEVIKGMYEAEDFYGGEIAQIHTPTLSRGRIALCGDAAYCPSPVSGSGTTCAFVGAYLLAGEIATSLKQKEDIDEALKRYDTKMIPRARKYQSLPPGAPQILNPQSWWGLFILQTILRIVDFLQIVRLAEKLSGAVSLTSGFGIPEYDWAA